MKGKLIAIEGTDGSGKGLQTTLLVNGLNDRGIPTKCYRFPKYNSPTGQIIGECILGLDEFGDNPWFDNPSKLDYLVASTYYAADRRYNIKPIEDDLNNGISVILDRYVYSNMAHQGGKVEDKVKRLQVYKKIDLLEFVVMELPRPDDTYYLSVPYEQGEILRNKRGHKDAVEKDKEYLINSEKAYNELTDIYGFVKLDCVKDGSIRKIDDISNELMSKVLKKTFDR